MSDSLPEEKSKQRYKGTNVFTGSLNSRIEKFRLQRVFKKGPKKTFSGHLFDRFSGLDPLFEQCADCSVLDIGSSEGLISHEFVRHGASLIHGFDLAKPNVKFAKRLFQDIPIKNHFTQTDLAVSPESFQKDTRQNTTGNL